MPTLMAEKKGEWGLTKDTGPLCKNMIRQTGRKLGQDEPKSPAQVLVLWPQLAHWGSGRESVISQRSLGINDNRVQSVPSPWTTPGPSPSTARPSSLLQAP